MWSCSGKTGYKDLRVCSLAFSSDGSLLAVGFGNTLCVNIPDTLLLKCALSAPAGLDGGTNKLIINLPSTKAVATKTSTKDKHKKILQTIKSYLNTNDTKLINEIAAADRTADDLDQPNEYRLSSAEQKLLATTILRAKELNFYQKIELFQQLQLHGRLPDDLHHQFQEYLRINDPSDKNLHEFIQFLGENVKFLAKRKHFCYTNRQSNVEQQQQQFFTFGNQSSPRKNDRNGNDVEVSASSKQIPMKITPEIKHVVFGSSDFSHLVSLKVLFLFYVCLLITIFSDPISLCHTYGA